MAPVFSLRSFGEFIGREDIRAGDGNLPHVVEWAFHDRENDIHLRAIPRHPRRQHLRVHETLALV